MRRELRAALSRLGRETSASPLTGLQEGTGRVLTLDGLVGFDRSDCGHGLCALPVPLNVRL